MAISKTSVLVLAATSATAGATTKVSPAITGAWIDLRAYAGGEWTWKITNGAGAPGVPLTGIFQVSHDGAAAYDYGNLFSGDTVASSVNSNSVVLDRGVMYGRIIGWGNTTNSVTLESYIQAVVG